MWDAGGGDGRVAWLGAGGRERAGGSVAGGATTDGARGGADDRG
jgi:hypothetical protein